MLSSRWINRVTMWLISRKKQPCRAITLHWQVRVHPYGLPHQSMLIKSMSLSRTSTCLLGSCPQLRKVRKTQLCRILNPMVLVSTFNYGLSFPFPLMPTRFGGFRRPTHAPNPWLCSSSHPLCAPLWVYLAMLPFRGLLTIHISFF
jgi:hypothetical protein